jgi:hypothetical protein
LRAFDRTPGEQKSEKIVVTVKITAPVRLVPVAMLVETPTVEPSPLYPEPSHEKGRRRGRQRPDPPLFSFFLSATSRPL